MKYYSVLLVIILILGLFSCSGEIKGTTLLHWSAQEGHIDVLKDLLADGNIPVNQLNEEGETALLLALQNEKFQAAALLADNGATLDFVDERGWNYLHWAAFTGAEDLARKFLEIPTLADGVNQNNNTPLHLALEREHREIAKMLLNQDVMAGVNQQNNQGNTPLHLACSKGYNEIVDAILKKQAQLDVKNKRGYYPIQLAAEANHKSIVKMLMKAGADESVIWPARDFLDMIF